MCVCVCACVRACVLSKWFLINQFYSTDISTDGTIVGKFVTCILKLFQ